MKRSPVLSKRYGTIIVLSLLAMFASSLAVSATCESIRVTGAGHAAANGTYVHTGTDYGKPAYELGGSYRITWMGNWYLLDFVGGSFYENASSADEPPSTGWRSFRAEYDPAPTLSCADLPPAPATEPPAPEPNIVARSYEMQNGSLTLVYKNIGDASATVVELCAGPALMAQNAEGTASFWIPDSDLWMIIPLEHAYNVEPGDSLVLILPMVQLPTAWMERAAARSAVFTGFAFGAPHVAVGVRGFAASWIHLAPAWLEATHAPRS